MESVEEHASPTIRILIVGHKVDLQDYRNVSTEEGRKVSMGGFEEVLPLVMNWLQLAENYDAQFVEASAKMDINCSQVSGERGRETGRQTLGCVLWQIFTLLAADIKAEKESASCVSI